MSIPIERLLLETRRVHQALDQAADETCTAFGLTAGERALLDRLARERRPVDVAELARTALMPPAELMPLLLRLQTRGWAELGTTDTGAGPREITLNAAGREVYRRLHAHQQALLQQLGAAVDDHALKSTFATLRSVRRLLQRTGAVGSLCVPCGEPPSV